MKNIFYLIPLMIVQMSFVAKDDTYIWFPSKIGIVENCEGNEVSIKFELETDSRKKIQVHDFKFSNQDFTLIANGEKRINADKLFVSKKIPLQIEIIFKRKLSASQSLINFKTDDDNYQNNDIRIIYGEYYIDSESVRSGKEQILNFSESCNDSLTIHFPYGGTVSGAAIFKDSTELDSPVKYVSYGMLEEKNYLKFSQKEKGRYYVRFGACHWGNEFWLTIK